MARRINTDTGALKVFSLRLPDKLRAAASKAAKGRRRQLSAYIRGALTAQNERDGVAVAGEPRS